MLVEIVKRGGECTIAEGQMKVDGGKWVYVTSTGKVED